MQTNPPNIIQTQLGKLFTHCSFASVINNSIQAYDNPHSAQHWIYDLASLTKVIATTSIFAKLQEQGRVSHLDKVKNTFPICPDSNLTWSSVLAHCGGFKSWLPLYERQDPLEESLFVDWDQSKVNKTTEYSDLGFLLIGLYLEKKTSQPLSELFDELILSELKKESGYTYLKYSPPQNLKQIPNAGPTAHLKASAPGLANDDNYNFLKQKHQRQGWAHAGLWGTANDVALFASLWLKCLKGNSTFLKQKTALTFWNTHPNPQSARSLGWDGIASDGTSSAGSYFSSETRGHLGFTGTSLWVDPKQDLAIVLLTNRTALAKDVFDKKPMYEFRKEFHNYMMQSLLKGKSS